MKLTEEQRLALSHASSILCDVQIQLLRADEALPKEQRNDFWRELFSIRSDLNVFRYIHRG